MTMRLVLTIATLAGLLASPTAGISETRVLSVGGDAPGFWAPSAESRCCSPEDSLLALGPLLEEPNPSIPTDWKIEVQAPAATYAGGPYSSAGGGPNQSPDGAADTVATAPGTADLEAARVAAPPQSGLRRMLSAVIDLGSAANSKP
jgi:hypothetical protein